MKEANPLMIAPTRVIAFVTPDVEHADLPKAGQLVQILIHS
jgi:hypothetical protein